MQHSCLKTTQINAVVQRAEELGYKHRTQLCEIMTGHGSDKGTKHNYSLIYDILFRDVKDEPLKLLEVGLGTNKEGAPSTMGPNGRPGASLRGWRDFFPHAEIYGADIDRDILFAEERIKTAFVNQLEPSTISAMFRSFGVGEGYDVIIDDGLHELRANACLLLEAFAHLKPGGIYIIEDVTPQDTDRTRLFAETIAEGFSDWRFLSLPSPVDDPTGDNQLVVFVKKA